MSQPLTALRALMQKHGLDAFIVPSEDPHQSEYVAPHWQHRSWLSGFTGSAGTAVVTADHAGLWTDGRYYLQAEQTFAGTQWLLHKTDGPTYINWLCDNLQPGQSVGVDAFNVSAAHLERMRAAFSQKGISLVSHLDLPGEARTDRPSLPVAPIFEMSAALVGESRSSKLKRLRQHLVNHSGTHVLITTLDDIAWVLNMRGSDVPCNPVAISYLLVGKSQAWLFINQAKVPADVAASLAKDRVHLMPYEEVSGFLAGLTNKDTLLGDQNLCNAALWALAGSTPQHIELPTVLMKAIKNKTEMKHIRQTMVLDGVAMVRFLRWLETAVPQGQETEYTIGKKLSAFRAEQPGYKGDSFDAIVGYNSNGAVIHYKAEEATALAVKPAGILLVDSGGQYLTGTTDITRTVALGPPTAEQIHHNTLVLRGHINLAMAVFPKGTRGWHLDTLARMPLWQAGLDYGHGTGHGVGFYLCVHEPPQGFRHESSHPRASTPHEPGMFSSNEPGFYLNGQYGIRIENLVLCVPDSTTGFGSFYKLETVTLCPIDTRLIDVKMLTKAERAWLNAYHAAVYRKLLPHLQVEEQTWLKGKCARI